ncbi:hypothetical protein GCK32_021690 [Trichostrongylus colubriformis]|uniref:Activin types I and II receptor domain-containing protein n=1 Tax=Trichostrongylus colubriformis TaxID=6319 RepID=A0AAN8IE93_TRICO
MHLTISGSKGVLNGKSTANFLERTCEEGMIHCFESYSDDFTEITASCQTPNTEKKLLDVCKARFLCFIDLNRNSNAFQTGCINHPDLNVTVCCCDTDLCNLPDSEKPTKGPNVVLRVSQEKQPRSSNEVKILPSL